jgi:NADH:ubiquinone oxidoreductase subunit K
VVLAAAAVPPLVVQLVVLVLQIKVMQAELVELFQLHLTAVAVVVGLALLVQVQPQVAQVVLAVQVLHQLSQVHQ